MKLMKKIPGGTLLIPMLVSALITTFVPTLFHIGGITEAFFAGKSLNFILGSAIFISGCGLKLKTLNRIIKRYGSILVFRLLINTIAGVLFVKLFGIEGFLGLSAIAFICTITSINPTLFLALAKDFGDDVDKSAFGFVSLVASPVVPMFIYGLTMPTEMDLMPIVSTLIPLVAGIIIGNLDHEFADFLSSGMSFIIVLLGWSVGASINLIEAIKAGLPGIIMIILFYLLSVIPMYAFERFILKRNGISAISLSTAAGLSASVPIVMLTTNPELAPFTSGASAITTLVVIATAVITPLLAKKVGKNNL